MDTEAQRVSRVFKSHLEAPLSASVAISVRDITYALNLKQYTISVCVCTNTLCNSDISQELIIFLVTVCPVKELLGYILSKAS